MDSGIAKVRCDRIPSVDGMNALEVLRYLVKSFVPPDTLPTVRSAADGIFEPVFIVVNILQGNRLRTDVPAAERVVLVTADVETLVGLNSDFDAADRFAKIAGAIVRGAISGDHHDGFRESLASGASLRHYFVCGVRPAILRG